MTIRTTAQLRRLCRRWAPEWRDRLGLRDWHIDLAYAQPHEFREGATVPLASCTPDFPLRQATIKFLRPEAGAVLGHPTWDDTDPEVVIVHELLHIWFGACGVSLGTDYSRDAGITPGVVAEQAINAIANALVKARKGTKR